MASTTYPRLQPILEILNFPPARSGVDKKMARPVAEFELEARHLLGNEKANSWLTGDKQSWLLNVSFTPDVARAHFLGISGAVAAMIDAREINQPNMYPLVYICGCHTDGDSGSRTADIWRDLSAQLAEHMLYNKVEVDSSCFPVADWDATQGPERQVELLWQTFRTLVSRLPKGSIIYCIIDGVLHLWDCNEPANNAISRVVSKLKVLVDQDRYMNDKTTKVVLTMTGPDLETRWSSYESYVKSENMEIYNVGGYPATTLRTLLDAIGFDDASLNKYVTDIQTDRETVRDYRKNIRLYDRVNPPREAPKEGLGPEVLLDKEAGKCWLDGNRTSWMVKAIRQDYADSQTLSWLSAMVNNAISKATHHGSYALIYFCGLHEYAGSEQSRIPEMMKSLFAQLANQMLAKGVDVQLRDIQQSSIDHAKAGHERAFRFLFQQVVEQLPEHSIVHIILDNPTYYYHYGDPGVQMQDVLGDFSHWIDRLERVHVKFVMTLPGPDMFSVKAEVNRIYDYNWEIKPIIPTGSKSHRRSRKP